MRIKLNKKQRPKLGDEKIVNKFAWFPIRIDNVIIWLEKYTQTYVWEEVFHCMEDGGPNNEWCAKTKNLI